MLVPLLTVMLGHVVSTLAQSCYALPSLDRTLHDEYCDQPMFAIFLVSNEALNLVDNICLTYFPLPDDPDTFQVYTSQVYCDGSNAVFSQIATQEGPGLNIKANPACIMTDQVVAYAGCDCYIMQRCVLYGNCGALYVGNPNIYGFSPLCRPLALSCLQKVQEIMNDNCLPDQDFYVLPMKLPHRCVTQQLCTLPPNPFYPQLPRVSLL